MKWSELFNNEQVPSHKDTVLYLSDAAIIWNELNSYIKKTYQVKPQMTYSKCSAQPGWNVKYKKSGKSLCTLYPMPGYFIALVVVGAKEKEEVERGMEAGVFTSYLKELYRKTAFSAGGRWLMIEVKDKAVLNDVKNLMSIRVKPKTMGDLYPNKVDSASEIMKE